MSVLEQLNKEQDQEISTKELRDAIQPGGFLDNKNQGYEDHIKSVGETLKNSELSEDDKKLVESLRKTLNDEKEKIKTSNEVTEEDKRLLRVWIDLFRDNDDVKNEVKELEELINGPSSETKTEGDDATNIDDVKENDGEIVENNEIDPKDDNILREIDKLGDNDKQILGGIIDYENTINSVDEFLNEDKFNPEDLNIALSLDCLGKIIEQDTERLTKLKNKIKNTTISIIENHFDDIISDKERNYSLNEIKVFQLRGKYCGGADLNIDGNRGNIYSSDKSTNEGLTNLCINQLEHIALTGKQINVNYNINSYEEFSEVDEKGKMVDEILNKGTWTLDNIKTVNERNKSYGEKDNYRKLLLDQKIYEQLEKMSDKVSQIIKKNDQYSYSNSEANPEVQMIQLYANVIYGEDLTIDGKRENSDIYGTNCSYDLSKNTGITNMYICIFEIKFRKGVMNERKEFFKSQESKRTDHLLSIPNIDARLKKLNDEERSEAMDNFFDTFLKIRKSGKGFEDKINKNGELETLLTYYINAESYKSIDDIIRDELLNIDNHVLMNPEAYDKEKIEELKNKVRIEIGKFSTPKEYFLTLANDLSKSIIEDNKINKENNDRILLNNMINGKFKELNKILEEETKIKDKFKKEIELKEKEYTEKIKKAPEKKSQIEDEKEKTIKNILDKQEQELKPIKESKREKLIEITTSDYFGELPENAKENIYTIMRQEYSKEELDSRTRAFEGSGSRRLERFTDYFVSYNEDRTKWAIIARKSEKNPNNTLYYLNTESGERYLGQNEEGLKLCNELDRYKKLPEKIRKKVGKIVYIEKENGVYEFNYMVENKAKGIIECHSSYQIKVSGEDGWENYDGWNLKPEDVENGFYSIYNIGNLSTNITIDEMNKYRNARNIKNMQTGINDMIDKSNKESKKYGSNTDFINIYESIEGNQRLEEVKKGEYYRISSKDGPTYFTKNPGNIHEGSSGNYYFRETYNYINDKHKNEFKMFKLNIGDGKQVLVECFDEKDIQIVEKLNEKLNTEGGKLMPSTNGLYSTFNNVTKSHENYNGYPETPLIELTELKRVKEGNNGELLKYDIYTRDFKSGISDNVLREEPRIISNEERKHIKELNNQRYSLLQTPELTSMQPHFSVIGMQNRINELYNQMGTASIKWEKAERSGKFFRSLFETKGGLSEEGVNEIFTKADKLHNMCRSIKGDVPILKELRNYLGKFKEGQYEIDTGIEQYINGLYNQVDFLIGFLEGNNFVQFCNYFQNARNVRSNDTTLKRLGNRFKENGIKVLFAIAAAVGVMVAIPSGGTSLLGVAALSTIAGMGGQRLGTWINEGLQDCLVSDEYKNKGVRFDDPTDIELLKKGEVSVGDFLSGITMEFLQGTATTFGFMYFGQVLGSAISTSNSPFANVIKKIFKGRFDTSGYADDMINGFMKKGQEQGFCKRFLKEFGEECREEIGETGGDMIGQGNPSLARLGGMISLYHSLTPGPNLNIMQNTNANFDAMKCENRGGKKVMVIDMRYDPTITYEGKTSLEAIQDYYIGNGNGSFEYNKQTQTITRKGDPSKKTMESVDVEIRLIPTRSPIEVRTLVGTNIGNELGITVNDETGECEYDATNPDNINRLRVLYEKDGGVCKINSDGSLTITDKNNNIFTIKPSLSIAPQTKIENQIKTIQNMKEGDIIALLDGNSGIKLEDLNANDLRLLMFKACNMGLDFQIIEKLGVTIEHSIINNPKIQTDIKTELKNYVNKLCYLTEIKNVNINGDISIIGKTLDEIQQHIEEVFKKDPITVKELSIEINKKKFELYKKNGNVEQAQNMVNLIREQNTELLSNDTTNFRYRRGVIETDLLEIQLGGEGGKKALDRLNTNAQEVREKTETIGGRTDTETLISKIEAGILLGKSEAELQPYLDFLALTEHGTGINILGTVIQTINTTFDSDGAKGALEKYANDVTDAGKKSKDSNLLEAGAKAKKTSETYNEMKNDLDNDSNRIHHSEIQGRLEKFIKGREISSISDIGNDFSHFTILLNPQAAKSSPVMSIEIGKVDYETAYNTLKAEFEKEGIDIEGDIGDFNTFILKFNKVVDNRIRTTFGTENLQELNSPEHRALFDYIAAKYMESRRGDQNASLTNLSQLFGVKGLQDCRLHAFTKQLFFDSWKTNKLNSLEKSKTGDPKIDAEINKQIKIIENTKMIFMDAKFSGNVDMNTIYVARTESGHMETGSQNNVIEEHTFNLIEMPILDEEGNIQIENGKIKTKICFADSFYQGSIEGGFNTGKVYDLSYTGRDISGTIYGKKGEDVYMTTTVTDVNGNIIDIKIKPCDRSMKGRGENITGSSIETRGPSTDETTRLNDQYKEGLEIVEILRRNRTEIKENCQNILTALESGQSISIDDIEKALVSSDGHKVTEWQANQIKRAFELLGKVPESKRGEALNAIQTMINNTITQNVIDFAGAKGDATEFLQTEGVFFNAMQIFNETFKENINKALDNLNPQSIESIQNVMDAIIEYQIIYEEDMKSFFERSQQTMLDDGKRGEEYHRNNFEHVAKRFQADMEIYSKAVESLENLGLFEQAYEIRKYMVDQGNILLEHSDKLLGHMIDFKKVKKEMKGIEGREIYIQLKEIQAKGIGNVEAELKKRGIDPKKIKEMVGIDASKPFNSETLSEAINNIEESGLKEYYDTIALVFNPDILAITIESSVYSKGGYKVEEEFNTETKEDYIARKNAEIETSKKININTTSGEIGQTISKEILDKIDPSLLTGKSKKAIQAEIQHLADLCIDCGIKGQEAYNICKKATEALVFQTTESQTRVMGDHGINHISGNISKLNTYLDAGVKGGKIPASDVGKYKLMGALTHIFHDIGYAAIISKGSGSFDGSAIHPFTSKAFFDSNVKSLLEGTEINANLISHSIEAHDGTRLDFSTTETTFLSMVNLSDNMALGVDKMALLCSNPKLLNNIATIYALDATGINLDQAKKIIIENIRKDSSITPTEQESLISAINELSGRNLAFIDFWSISPLTTMEFSGNVPTLNMYQGTNLMLVAEACGIQVETEYVGKTKIIAKDEYGKEKIGLKDAIATKNRARIIELIQGKKFCSQIVKPLGNYADNYEIMDSDGHKYPKTDGKYNMDEIKADLLLGKQISLNDGKGPVLYYKYEIATDESILAEKNSVYGHIDTAEMLGRGVEAIGELNLSGVIEDLGSINETTKEILNKIKDKKPIEINDAISSIEDAIDDIASGIRSGEYKVNEEFKESFESLKLNSDLFVSNLKENKHADIKPIAEAIQEQIEKISSFLVRE